MYFAADVLATFRSAEEYRIYDHVNELDTHEARGNDPNGHVIIVVVNIDSHHVGEDVIGILDRLFTIGIELEGCPRPHVV